MLELEYALISNGYTRKDVQNMTAEELATIADIIKEVMKNAIQS